MPDLNIKRPFRIVKVLMILKGISKLFCINTQDKRSVKKILAKIQSGSLELDFTYVGQICPTPSILGWQKAHPS